MEDTTWRIVLDRLLEASGSRNETALAAHLGISNQSIYNAKNKKQIPPAWVFDISKTFSVSADWLFFGRGPKYNEEPPHATENTPKPPVNTPETASCARCAKLEEKLERMEEERRELSAENRQLNTEIRQLAKENGELRETCATLKERQKHCCPDGIFKGTQNIPYNNELQP